MRIFVDRKDVENDEADIRILRCLEWTHPEIETLTEAEIENKINRLYPPCLFLQKKEGEGGFFVRHDRTFDVPTNIAGAVAKGFVGVMKDVATGNAQKFFITKRGNELIAPRKRKGKK